MASRASSILAASPSRESEAIEVVLVLPVGRYDGFARELDALREKTGAASNTQAVLDAVKSRLASE